MENAAQNEIEILALAIFSSPRRANLTNVSELKSKKR